MSKLEEKIKALIKKEGFITVDKFMEKALFDPDYGYYITKNPIGQSSDFITSPEISVLFGEIIGAFIVTQINEKLKDYEYLNLVELGAGKGTLFNDIMNLIKRFPKIYKKVKGYIIDVNPVLVEAQKKTLTQHPDKIVWVEGIENIESPSPCIFICNEFFDALPIRQFVKNGDLLKERIIRLDSENNFIFDLTDRVAPPVIKNDLGDYDDGTVIEYSEAQIGFMEKICERIKSAKGFALIIDYGYADFTTGDTLQSIYKHQYNNVFDNIGEADLTAHVNFRLLYNTALQKDIKDIYLQTQKDFLTAMGILMRLENISRKLPEKQKNDLFMRANRLISSSQMGELFKFLIVENF